MRHTLLVLLGALALTTAHATETPPPAATLPLLKQGYAFDQPEVLIRQRLFGLAHGVSLLAAACLDLPAHSSAIQDAYAAWRGQQGASIDGMAQALAIHHFGQAGATTANWQDLMRALQLKDSIAPALGEIRLDEACATLPEALRGPRYAFDALLREADAPPAPAAVSPAPTINPNGGQPTRTPVRPVPPAPSTQDTSQ